MNTIQEWKTGTLTDSPNPRRIIVTPEPNCNLECEHCYFAHNRVITSNTPTDWSDCINYTLHHDLPLFCAGRVVTERVTRFVETYLSTARKRNKTTHLSVVDNGYTVFKLQKYFDQIEEFNISIDGRDAEHDIQRRKVGSARIAWDAIYKLQRLGYDPLIASCISPLTMPGWAEFEKEVEQADIRLSAGPTLQIQNTRDVACYRDETLRAKALELLVTGIPKLVQLYDLRDIAALKRVLGPLTWQEDDDIPGLTTTLPNGVFIVYRPESILWNVEYVVHHDGVILNHPRTNTPFNELLRIERVAWGFET